MLKIRLIKTGRKNQPFYRIVVTDSRNAPQGGRAKEKVGFLNPFTKEKGIDEERIKYWLSVGAQPSDRVHNILVEEGIITGQKINVLKKKSGGDQGSSQPSESKSEPEAVSQTEAPPVEKAEEKEESGEASPAEKVEEKEESSEAPESDSDKKADKEEEEKPE
jgi:small subunit ribosomal protein S16